MARSSPPPEGGDAPRIAAVVLAAGRSTRAGEVNKLLAHIDGVAMVGVPPGWLDEIHFVFPRKKKRAKERKNKISLHDQ